MMVINLESLHALLVTDLSPTTTSPTKDRAETWYHPHHLGDRAKLHDILELLIHVPQCKSSFLNVFHHLLLIHIEIFHPFHKSFNVSRTKQLAYKRFLLKRLQIINVFPSTNKYDRTLCSCHSRQGTSSFSMTIKLCDNNTGSINLLLKCFSLSLTSLSNTSIHHKHHIVRPYSITDCQHLLKQTVFLLVPSTGINYNDLKTLSFEHVHTIPSNHCRVHLCVTPIERYPSLGSILLQLVISPSSEGVSTDEAALPVLLLVVISHLGTGGGLARPLKTNKHDHICLSLLWLVRFDPRVHQSDKLLEYSLLNDNPLVQTLSNFIKINCLFDIVFS